MKILNLISIAVCSVVLCGLGCSRSETTKAQAMAMFDKAGGVDKVDQEAKVIFDRFGTNDSITIYGPSLTNFPAISSLGKSVFLQNKNNPPGWSAHIAIPFGTHYQRSFIFIFNSANPIEFPYASRCIEVATNIFVGK